MAVEAGEDGARRHQLAGLVPAVGVAEAGGVALTLLVQDGVQPGRREEGILRFALVSFVVRHRHVSLQ